MKTIINYEGLHVVLWQKYVNRPTIVFLHDSLGCIELWREFPQQLGESTQCNVLVYDRQGYGKSKGFSNNVRKQNYLEIEADILNGLIENLGIKDVVLFGHSDGGSIALITAAKYSKNIKGIVIEGGHIFVEDITLKGIAEAVKTYQTTHLKERLLKYHGDKTDAVFGAWANTWLSEEFRDWNIEHFLPKIQCPTMVIQGENDEFGTLKQVDGIVNQVLGKTLKWVVKAVGHNPHKEDAKTTLTAVAKFINDYI